LNVGLRMKCGNSISRERLSTINLNLVFEGSHQNPQIVEILGDVYIFFSWINRRTNTPLWQH
jgi:hypothetical protein